MTVSDRRTPAAPDPLIVDLWELKRPDRVAASIDAIRGELP